MMWVNKLHFDWKRIAGCSEAILFPKRLPPASWTVVDFFKFLSTTAGIQELCIRGAPVENYCVDIPSWEGWVLIQIHELTLFSTNSFEHLLTNGPAKYANFTNKFDQQS